MCCGIPSCFSMQPCHNPYEVRSVLITKEFAIVNFVDSTTPPQEYKISYVKENTIFCEVNTEISIEQKLHKKPKTLKSIQQIHRERKWALFGVEIQYIQATIIWNNIIDYDSAYQYSPYREIDHTKIAK